MADSTGCQVCSKLMDKFRSLSQIQTPLLQEPTELGNLSDIIDMPCPHAGSIRRAWEVHAPASGQHLRGSQHWQWTLEAGNDVDMTLKLVFRKRVPEDDTDVFTVPTRLILRPDEAGHAGTTSVLNPQWADLSIMRNWLQRCINEHGEVCDHPDWMKLRPEPIAMPEWLVDVDNYCVVECNADTAGYPYIALSYTWGGVQCLKHTSRNLKELKKKDSLHPGRTPDIPRTVQDAFEITRSLGQRYLWVDSLCIPQDEPTATTRGLNSMHHIYANSTICLIAFAGTDANHGLRGIEGVSAPRHVEQVIYDIADGEKFSWIPDSCKSIFDMNAPHTYPYGPGGLKTQPLGSIHDKPPDGIEGSRYTERGWTYQEYAFAKRRLIFTDGLLHWTCQCADWGEGRHGNILDLPKSLYAGSTSWLTSTGPNLRLIEKAASGLTNRYFTYEEDIVKAFLGIQNHISRDFPGGFNYGHPQVFFDISLLWRPSHPRSSCKRRLGRTASSDPPSWSWMGWQGHHFFFEKDDEYMMQLSSCVGFTQSVAQWYTMRDSLVPVLDLQPVNCQWQIHRAAAKISSAHVPSGWRKAPYSGCDSDYHYRRESADEGTSNSDGTLSGHTGDQQSEPIWFKYPIPLPAHTEMCTWIEQRPFLYTRTFRAFFTAKARVPGGPPPFAPVHVEYPFNLFCDDGECAGLLSFHDALSEPCFQVEVVAVVKGWTGMFSVYFLSSQERQYTARSPFEWPAEFFNEFLARSQRRHDCYFVLCVKWENGIAKRQGSGMVKANIWERNKEPVELILG